ncbi:MAG TPA: tetratricopeptide repeat protein [Bryobacteraceae bacterium]|jgi:tetratricopeptide (TPR) repeat protein|nr:tetratricopeptide repeat protein [Bryobacteraceae bacterium]
MRLLPVLLLLPLLCSAADELTLLRDHQDRKALEAKAASLDAAAQKKPNDADAWYRGALAYSYAAEVAMEKGDKGGSKRDAEAGVAMADKAIEINNRNADYYTILGTLCGQIVPANPMAGILIYGKKAKDALDKAVAMNPKSARAFVAHGVGYYYLPANFGGGPAKAIQDFQRAISLDPKSAEAYLWMGIALRKEKQNAKAQEALKKSLALDPERLWTKQQLAKTPAE